MGRLRTGLRRPLPSRVGGVAGQRVRAARIWPAMLILVIGIVLLVPKAGAASGCDVPGQDIGAAIASCSLELASATDDAARARLLTQKAKLERGLGDIEGAAASLDEAARLAPENADIWLEKGYLERSLGNGEAALAAVARAREAAPEDWRPAVIRLDMLADAGRYEECLEDAPRAVALAPESAHLYAFRGRCLYETGRVAEAIADYEKASGIGLEESFLYGNLALAYLDSGENERAAEAARRGVALDFADELAQWTLVEALMGMAQSEEAVAAFEATRAAALPDSFGRANQLAWLLYLAGEPEPARRILEDHFAAAGDGISEAYEADTYGHVLAALGERGKAVEAFQLAAHLDGAEREEGYRLKLEGLGIEVGEGGLETALHACVARGAACRISD